MRIPAGHVRTVQGDVPASELGRVNAHEHAFQVSPLLPGDELDDPERSGEEFGRLAASGFDAVIDATPIGLGRKPLALASVAVSSGLRVIAATGIHRDAHYAADDPLLRATADDRAQMLLRDIREGIPADDAVGDGTAVRAGIAKVGLDYWRITASQAATIEAIAQAHEATRVPVMVHLEFCTAAHEALDRFEALGVAADRILLAHADRSPDPGLHADLASRGAWLGYDGMARPRVRSDAELLDLTARVLEIAPNRILLGGDVARASRYIAYGGIPGIDYLGRRYLPRLRARIGDAAADRMLTANAAAFLGAGA